MRKVSEDMHALSDLPDHDLSKCHQSPLTVSNLTQRDSLRQLVAFSEHQCDKQMSVRPQYDMEMIEGRR